MEGYTNGYRFSLDRLVLYNRSSRVSDIIKGVVLLRGGEKMEIKITKYDKKVVVDNGEGTVERYSVTVNESEGVSYNEPDLSKSQVVGKVLAVLYQE